MLLVCATRSGGPCYLFIYIDRGGPEAGAILVGDAHTKGHLTALAWTR
ncbi:hypothetical protein Q31a_04450 [Aureliella helgolandensis]|uniref:Uncharacterized protein n=1 Tax=Aureliella helgolandensis TaxID=2527968 RepID=A0A518G0N1_9BACT|nr:hypothetical protein Q31a_04450 [Aureliella helgolandensis]